MEAYPYQRQTNELVGDTMHCIKDDRGFALISILLIGFISMVLISTLFYTLVGHTKMSGKDKRYLAELEVAKGASHYIMAEMRNDNLTCNNSDCSSGNNQIDIDNNVCTALAKQNCDGITATLLSRTEFREDPNADLEFVYSARVTSTSAPNPEKAEVEFIYRVW